MAYHCMYTNIYFIIMRKSLKLLMLLISIVFISCKKDRIELTKEFENYETSIKIPVNVLMSNGGDPEEPTPPDSAEFIVESDLSLNFNIPDNFSQQDLALFLNQNINNLNGEIKIYTQGQLAYHSTLSSGVETILYPTSSHNEYPRAGECGYEGIRQCANKAIYSQGTISKILCAFEFWACYAEEVANCIEANCIDEGKPPINVEITGPSQEGNSTVTFLPERDPGFCNLYGTNSYETKYFLTLADLETLTLSQLNITASVTVYYDNSYIVRLSANNQQVPDGFYSIDCGEPYQEFIEIVNGIPIKVYKKTF